MLNKRERFYFPVFSIKNGDFWDFPGGTVVKNPPTNSRDTGWSPGPGLFLRPLDCPF